MNNYNWDRINVLSEKDVWEEIDKNNVTVVVNVLCAKKELNS